MKLKKVIAFGCSWTYGDELCSPELVANGGHTESPENDSYRLAHVYGGLIAQHYSAEFDNRAHNGGSLQSMIWAFEEWLTNADDIENTLLLFGLTHPVRTSWWQAPTRYIHSGVLESSHNPNLANYHELHKHYRSCISDPGMERLAYQTAVHLFSGTCERLNIPYVQYNIFSEKNTHNIPYSTVINQNSSLVELITDLVEQGLPVLGDCHPNELGHRYIADYLIEYIEQTTLLDLAQ